MQDVLIDVHADRDNRDDDRIGRCARDRGDRTLERVEMEVVHRWYVRPLLKQSLTTRLSGRIILHSIGDALQASQIVMRTFEQAASPNGGNAGWHEHHC
jgi:hypothetical protein